MARHKNINSINVGGDNKGKPPQKTPEWEQEQIKKWLKKNKVKKVGTRDNS